MRHRPLYAAKTRSLSSSPSTSTTGSTSSGWPSTAANPTSPNYMGFDHLLPPQTARVAEMLTAAFDNPWEHAGLTLADVLTRDGTIEASVGKKELDTDKGERNGLARPLANRQRQPGPQSYPSLPPLPPVPPSEPAGILLHPGQATYVEAMASMASIPIVPNTTFESLY